MFLFDYQINDKPGWTIQNPTIPLFEEIRNLVRNEDDRDRIDAYLRNIESHSGNISPKDKNLISSTTISVLTRLGAINKTKKLR